MIKFLQAPGKLKKYVLGGILVFICLAMVTYLIPGFTSGSFGTTPGVLAKVNGEDITLQEAQQTARQMARQQFPRGNVPSFALPYFTKQAVDQLVIQKAAMMEAERMGLKVTDQDLRDYLKKIPALFPNGQFIGDEAYASLLQQNNLTVAQFESDTKKQILLGMLRNIVEGSANVSDQELQQEYTRKNTKVKFDYAVLTSEDVLKQIKPTDAELKAFYDNNKDMYKNAIPEKRKAQYVVIDPLKLQAQVSAQDLKNYYNQHQDEYRVPEEVTLRQIMVKTPPTGPDGKVDQKAVDAARAKLQDVLTKVKAGGNFA
jgi:peptidyl-prolyl cis-trans isomerase D